MHRKSKLDTSAFGTFADLSNNNPTYSAIRYASAQHLLIGLKCTEGNFFFDDTWPSRVEASHAQNLSVLHYCFARPENGVPESDADFFWSHCKHLFSPKHRDRVCIDIETGVSSLWPSYAARFENRLHAISGKWTYNRLIGYTYSSGILGLGGALRLRSRQWWIAAFGPQQPPYELPGGQRLWAWQHSDSSWAAGIGNADQSYLNEWTTNDLHNHLRGSRLPRNRAR